MFNHPEPGQETDGPGIKRFTQSGLRVNGVSYLHQMKCRKCPVKL